MKTHTPLKNSPSENIHLPENKIASIRSKYISIKCLSGSLWVTWPNGLEQTLTGGQSVAGKTNGKVCIVSLSDARIQVKQKHMSWYSVFWGWALKDETKGHHKRRHDFYPPGGRNWPAVQYPP